MRSQGIETADGWAPRQESGHKKASPKLEFFFPTGNRQAFKRGKRAKRGKVSPGAESQEPGWVQRKPEESSRAGMTITTAPELAHRRGSSSGSRRSPGEQATRFSAGARLPRSVGVLVAGGRRQSRFVSNPGPALLAVVLKAPCIPTGKCPPTLSKALLPTSAPNPLRQAVRFQHKAPASPTPPQ